MHWTTLDLPRASYCWESGGRGVCADSPGVDVLLHSSYLKPYRTAGGYSVHIALQAGSQLLHSAILLVQGPDGKPGAIRMTGPLTFALPVVPPDGAGLYTYEVDGTWDEGSVSFYLVLELIPGVA
jgi:hypothetical protein